MELPAATAGHPAGRVAAATALHDADLFGTDYLLPRPLLAAIQHPGPRPAVLLIDEVDRADDEFEAFLLELLAEAAVTIPELGTFRRPRCRRSWCSPRTGPVTCTTPSSGAASTTGSAIRTTGRVADIIRRRVPVSAEWLADKVATAVGRLRGLGLTKPPGVAEAINWATALDVLGVSTLDALAMESTMGVVLKYEEDADLARQAGLAKLVDFGA